VSDPTRSITREPRTKAGRWRMERVREWAGDHEELAQHELIEVLAIEDEAATLPGISREPWTNAGRAPVRLKISGGIGAVLTPGTDWRVARVTTHHEPGGFVGEDGAEWTIIDFDPIEDEAAALPGEPFYDSDGIPIPDAAFAATLPGISREQLAAALHEAGVQDSGGLYAFRDDAIPRILAALLSSAPDGDGLDERLAEIEQHLKNIGQYIFNIREAIREHGIDPNWWAAHHPARSILPVESEEPPGV
jgi:hypothetical protein